jgi:hypothetical protein
VLSPLVTLSWFLLLSQLAESLLFLQTVSSWLTCAFRGPDRSPLASAFLNARIFSAVMNGLTLFPIDYVKEGWSILNFRSIAIAFGSIVAASIGPAGANQALQTAIMTTGTPPVRIDVCRAALLDTLTVKNYYLATAVDFTNTSQQAIEAVRFTFEVEDTFGVVTQTAALDWTGSFAPGVAIRARTNLGGTSGFTAQQNSAQTPTRVVCRVQLARYVGGTVWHPGMGAAPGLVYPTLPPPAPPK